MDDSRLYNWSTDQQPLPRQADTYELPSIVITQMPLSLHLKKQIIFVVIENCNTYNINKFNTTAAVALKKKNGDIME